MVRACPEFNVSNVHIHGKNDFLRLGAVPSLESHSIVFWLDRWGLSPLGLQIVAKLQQVRQELIHGETKLLVAEPYEEEVVEEVYHHAY